MDVLMDDMQPRVMFKYPGPVSTLTSAVVHSLMYTCYNLFNTDFLVR